jgi:hypothetical protein
MAPDALWAYGVSRAGARKQEPPAAGVAGPPVERIEEGGLALLVSAVPLDDFGEAPLKRNLNDLVWLERVARAHEAVLEGALRDGPVVPLRLCTIFDGPGGARRMLGERAEELAAALDALEGREEWSVKLLADPAALARAASGGGSAAAGEPESGAAYLMRRRAERDDREAVSTLAARIAEDVHAHLREAATDAVLRPPQNRELSGHEGEMLLNGAYLVDDPARLREAVDALRERHRDVGARIELSGPFPPYSFVGS